MPTAGASPTRCAARWPNMHGVPPAQRRLRVGIALQVVFGTLVNAVLHDPGPIGLNDKRMETRADTRVPGCGAAGVGFSPECAPAAR